MSVYVQPGSNIGVSSNVSAPEKSLGELFGDLTRETSQLVREELNLAKAEMTQKASKAAKDAVTIAAGAFVAYMGLLVLVAALVLGLAAAGMPAWVAALVVGLLFCIGGGIAAMQGIKALKQIDPIPHQTVETLKEDGQWIKDQK